MRSMLENRHHNIILDFNGGGNGDEQWKVYPLLTESESESESECMDYQRIRFYVSSCNGLLFFFDENDGEAYICNPTTNESKLIRLPPLVDFPPPGFFSFLRISCLGFDWESNDYKFIINVDHVFGNADCDSSDTRYVLLYSLKSDSWKTLTGFPSGGFAFTDPCVYADGSIYWLSDCSIIDSFDLAAETLSSFDLRPLLQAGCSYGVRLVDVCGGFQLGLVACKINSPYCFELWLKTAGAGWNIDKLLDFSLPQIVDLDHRYDNIIVLGFSRREMILYLAAAADGQVFAYDCSANHLKKLQIRLRQYRQPVFISYVETTFSPV